MQNRKMIISLLVGLLTGPTAYALDLKYEDLEKATLGGNSSVVASKYRLLSNEARTGFLWKSFLPKLGVVGGYERYQTGPYPYFTDPYGETEVRINLFNGFRDLHESQLRRAQAMIARAQSAIATQEKISEVRKLYLQLAYRKELRQLFENILKENEAAAKSARFRQNQGMVTRTDVLEFEIYAGQLRESIESERHEMEIISLQLSAALGMEQRNDLNPTDPLNHVHSDELLKTDFRGVMTAGAALIQGEENARVAESSKASSWWLPSIDLYSEYGLYTIRERDSLAQKDRNDWATGLQLSWTLFDMNAISDSSAAANEKKATHSDAKQKHRDYLARVKSLQEELIHLHELVHNSEERVKLSATYLSSTRGDYSRGVKNSPDVISAIEKQIGFQKELLDRKLQYQETRDHLIALTRNMTSPN